MAKKTWLTLRCSPLLVLQRKNQAGLSYAESAENQYLFSTCGAELGGSQIAGWRFEVSNNVPSNLTKGSGTDLSAVIHGIADLLIGL